MNLLELVLQSGAYLEYQLNIKDLQILELVKGLSESRGVITDHMRSFLKTTIQALIPALLCAVLFFSGCGQEEPRRKIDLSERRKISTSRELDSLAYACLPQYSHRVSFSRHHRLVEYLFEKTGRPVRQVFPDTFEAHVQMVKEGKIDISFSNPLVYTQLADCCQARAFARIVEKNGSPTFRGQIICRADNKAIESIRDCRDKRWMAVAPTSAAGYLFALDHFLSHGITKVEKIKQALLELNPDNPEHQKILEMAHFRGITPAKDQDFDPIRKLTRQVKVKSGD